MNTPEVDQLLASSAIRSVPPLTLRNRTIVIVLFFSLLHTPALGNGVREKDHIIETSRGQLSLASSKVKVESHNYFADVIEDHALRATIPFLPPNRH